MKNSMILLVKPREHKGLYYEHIEDVRLGYVHSVLCKAGFKCEVLDFGFHANPCEDDCDILIGQIEDENPSMTLFFIDKHPTNGPAHAVEMIGAVRRKKCPHRSHISVYGNTQIAPQAFLDTGADSVVLGEEESVLALASALRDGAGAKGIPGVACLDLDGSYCETPCTLLDDLDTLPSPSRYAYNESCRFGYCASILASRGCYGRCSFCYLRSKERVFGCYPVRQRSPRLVVDEIEGLHDVGVRDFYFCDDEFIQPGPSGTGWVHEMCNEIKRRGIDVRYSIYSRADCINSAVVDEMIDAGLYCVFLGVESFAQSALDRYGKGSDVEDNLHAIRLLQEKGVRIRLGTMFFDAETTVDELKENAAKLELVMSYRPELIYQSMFFSNMLIPLSDTPSHERADRLRFASIGSERFSNSRAQANYMKRSRVGTESLSFRSEIVSDIYTCVDVMAKRLYEISVTLENKFFESGLRAEEEVVLRSMTHFASIQFANIVREIGIGKPVEDCIVDVFEAIEQFACL